MEDLFPNTAAQEAAAGPAPEGVVSLAMNAAVWRTFDYLWPAEWPAPRVGMRVRAPFGRGNRLALGFVAGVAGPSAGAAGQGAAGAGRVLKAVGELIDSGPLIDESLWKLAQWISHYYLAPLGPVLAAMIPSAVGRAGPQTETVVSLAEAPAHAPGEAPSPGGRSPPCTASVSPAGPARQAARQAPKRPAVRLGPRQKRMLDELLEARRQGVESLPEEELLRHGGAGRESLKALVARGLVRLQTRPAQVPELAGQTAAADPFELNEDQQVVLDALGEPLAGGFSVTLLYGVTGSGKTEVYIRAIRRVIDAGRQAILLVPEIALATQTLQRLVERLPRVAVLHSGLSDSQRGFYHEQIRTGRAAVVVGPRSAVFAPAPNLGLVIVDEEHEGSYKQDNAPRYHARDVAVMRASLAGVPILLGSATPSLESLHNVQQGRYRLLRLPRRVRHLPMPRLQIVPLRKEMTPGRIELLGKTLTLKIAAALDRRRQVILLMNRRGYASYVFCPACHWIYGCEHCSRAMVYHRATDLALCHYCGHAAALPERCPACKGKLLLFGYGVQRVEGELARKFPAARVARMDSDTMTSPEQFQSVLGRVAAGEVDILLGTQMVAKGLDFPGVLLVGVASADTSLAIPDFRASERTFQLVVQVAGRAGRGNEAGEVVVQTLHEQEPAIVFATRHDYDGFAAREMPLRKEANLPPYSRLVRFIVRHRDASRAREAASKLAAAIRPLLPAGVRVDGPQEAGVRMVRNQFRFQLLLTASRAGLVQDALRPHMERLTAGLGAEVLPDVDPVNLM
jgi:primosomal protein N' (replication factor Y)